jgi:hypothetical protein
MDGPLVVGTRSDGFFDVGPFGLFCGFHRFGRGDGRVFDHVFDYCFFGVNQNRGFSRVDRRRPDRRDRFLPSRRWHLGVFVLVLGVTRGAACPLHLVVDHRDDRMICDAALARTVIV